MLPAEKREATCGSASGRRPAARFIAGHYTCLSHTVFEGFENLLVWPGMGTGCSHSRTLILARRLKQPQALPAAKAFWMNSQTFLLLNGCMRCCMLACQLAPS